jgi:phosphatidate cytidylyltransferase
MNATSIGSGADLLPRLATAVGLIVLVLAALRWLPTPALAVVFGVFAAIGMWEWTQLAGINRLPWRVVIVAATVLTMWVIYRRGVDASMSHLFIINALWWLAAAVLVWRYQCSGIAPPAGRVWRTLAGWAMILPAWTAMVVLQQRAGFGGVLTLLLVIWAADSAAYLIGRKLGRRRLASRVSPGKSWEGLAAGMLGAAVVGALCAPWLGFHGRLIFVVLVEVVVLVSVLGDLTESLFKRISGLKDSGSLLPGHGGVLDRIDSLLAAVPVFLIGYECLGGAA